MVVMRGLLAPLPLIALVAAVLLTVAGAAGGNWLWPPAITFVAVYGGASMFASGWLAVARPQSFAVRQQGWRKGERKQPVIDALGLLLYVAFFLAWFAFIPLDVFRLHLLPEPSALWQGLGLAAVVAGLAIVYAAIAENRFAAPTIHDQSDEGQTVISTGLYGVVRHPFYAGMLVSYIGTALWLGSYAGVIATGGFLVMTHARIVIEERWLREHLADYTDYAKRVRWRLIPFIL